MPRTPDQHHLDDPSPTIQVLGEGSSASPDRAALAADLVGVGWTPEATDAVLGPVAADALHREQPAAASLRLSEPAVRDEPVAVLSRLFLLGEPVEARALDRALPTCGAAGAAALGLVQTSAGEARAVVDLRPYAADDAVWWLASDLAELATGHPLGTDHVLGVGGASTTLARWTPRRSAGTALDLGTGCGVQAFHLARHADVVTGTDVSARALRFAAFNAALNAEVTGGPFAGRGLELVRGSLLEPVDGRRFDLVVSNPPFVITPRVEGVPAYEYRDGGLAGDAVVERLVRGVVDVLADGGTAQLLGNWEHRAGEGWQDRIRGWLPDGVDALLLQREVQDPAQYAETWARDGGHRPGSPEHADLQRAWLRDFAARGVEAVGFGVVTLRRTDAVPAVRVEDATGPLDGAMGDVVLDLLAAGRRLADTTDAALLDARLVVAPDVTEERFGTPGAPDPQVILLRQGGGLRRAVRADTALAGLVGACDGDLTVGQVTAGLAVLLDEPVGDLRARLLPQVRSLVADLFLA